MVTNAHCFELNEIYQEGLLKLVTDKMLEGWQQNHRFDPTLAFLPAPVTWIEFAQPINHPRHPHAMFRTGTILVRQSEDETALIHSLLVASDGDNHYLSEFGTLEYPLRLRSEPSLVERPFKRG